MGLAVVLMLVRLSAHAPWGDGLAVVLVGAAVWWVAGGVALARAAAQRPWTPLLAAPRSRPSAPAVVVAAGCPGPVSDRFARAEPGRPGASARRWRSPALAAHRAETQRRRAAWAIALDLLAVSPARARHPRRGRVHQLGRDPQLLLPAGHHPVSPGLPARSGQPAARRRGAARQRAGLPVRRRLHLRPGRVVSIVPIGYGTYGLLDGIMTAAFYVAGLRAAADRRGRTAARRGRARLRGRGVHRPPLLRGRRAASAGAAALRAADARHRGGDGARPLAAARREHAGRSSTWHWASPRCGRSRPACTRCSPPSRWPSPRWRSTAAPRRPHGSPRASAPRSPPSPSPTSCSPALTLIGTGQLPGLEPVPGLRARARVRVRQRGPDQLRVRQLVARPGRRRRLGGLGRRAGADASGGRRSFARASAWRSSRWPV